MGKSRQAEYQSKYRQRACAALREKERSRRRRAIQMSKEEQEHRRLLARMRQRRFNTGKAEKRSMN
jgi:hypothetical protein